MNAGTMQLPTFQEEPACAKCCPKLTFKQRIIGFGGCCVVGYLLSFIGTMTLIGGPTTANITAFAILYVVGNIIALFATGFLLGPKTQCRKMWHPCRRYTTGFYLAMLIIVFAVAVAKQHVAIVVFLLLIEVCAGFWYGISYIPFGRKMFCTAARQLPCLQPCFAGYDHVFPPKTMADKASAAMDKVTGGGGNKQSKGGWGQYNQAEDDQI